MLGVEVLPQVCNFKTGPVWGCGLNQVTSSSSPQAKGVFALVRRLLFNSVECLASAQSHIHGEYKCAVQPALCGAPARDLHKFRSECFFLHPS